MPNDLQADIDAIGAIPAVRAILDVVCRTTGMGFAAVARVTDERWIVCDVIDTIDFGLAPGGELKLETTICDAIRQNRTAVAIDNVPESAVYRDHPTPAMYGFKSYISMPIVLPNGEMFGTLCAISPEPARVETPEVLGMFRLFAELIAFHLDANSKLAASEQTLLTERAGSELREQFIAILGHDLRNPLASIDAGARMLKRQPLDDKAAAILTLMQASVTRMDGMIANVLDFARGRLGGGLILDLDPQRPLAPTLEQVLSEIRSAWPERTITAELALDRPVAVDHVRIAQLFSNLLGNAVAHSATEQPISVKARTGDGSFELSVANGGEPIAADAVKRLFQPFSRGRAHGGTQGLGLGLFIASEIARAHQGGLTVRSDAAETRFTFTMPLNQ